jgi:hypothetical protein
MSKFKASVVANVRALERLRDEARVPMAGRACMSIMGWSSTSMAARYQHAPIPSAER